MKRIYLGALLLLITLSCLSQVRDDIYFSPKNLNDSSENKKKEKIHISTENYSNVGVNTGLLMGGGGLVGIDFNAMIGNNVSLQFGFGAISYGAGLNLHFKPYLNSPFISLQYWHQGLGSTYYASYIGPMFVYRAKKYFQAGLGLGYILNRGSINYNGDYVLLYNIGLFFPI
jgi:hypothetical protein